MRNYIRIFMLVVIILGALFITYFQVKLAKAEAPTAPPLTIQEYAQMRVEQVFGVEHWSSFNRIVIKESNWRHLAQNKTSTAFGLMQFLDSTWSSVGYEKTDDPYVQIEAGIMYIKKRYSDPTKALAFHEQCNFY